MIIPLLKRRLYLWQNNLFPLLVLFMVFPIIVFSLLNLSLRHIFIRSLSDIPYDQWAFPGILFILSSMVIFPLIYREFYHLRVQNKILKTMALSPYTKWDIVISFLGITIFETIIISIFASVVFLSLVSVSFSLGQMIVMYLFLLLYLSILANLFISLSLAVESVILFFGSVFLSFIILFLGSGFLFELDFFPSTLHTLLSYLPFALVSQALRQALFYDVYNVSLIIGVIMLSILWSLGNSILLRKKLVQ
ncbi:MAG: ABC transporter permease [Candidatus Marinimicrobia bacterium]|nr:ABC transporter permease [Candidatus Neomarinimicrobiota bacterium]MBT4144449.1 ABC transporter permease [Candidatus Neomarinimicrobiota bacterium]